MLMPDPSSAFIVRRHRWETTVIVLAVGVVVFALMVLFTLACFVIAWARGDSPRGPLEAFWLSFGGIPLIVGVGLPVLLGVGFITTAEVRRDGDDEGVILAIDSDGVYLSKNWGPSCEWPGGMLTKPLAVEELAAVVRQHAPHLQVTDRGRIPD